MQNRIDNITKWIRTQVPEGGKAVLGISGGKDSTIAAALCVRALGKENVIGVLMPNGEQHDIDDSFRVCDLLDIERHIVNIGNVCYSLTQEVGYNFLHDPWTFGSAHGNSMIKTNLPARIRMTALYAVAAMYPNSRVVNTCNYSEDFVGYSTKYGDAAGDFSPLGGLTVREVLEIGDALGLPHYLVHKAPSDGMCGKTDEDNLGFTYDELDGFLLGESGLSPETMSKVTKLHNSTRHKYTPMPIYDPSEDRK
jgi:NAD+ synthase